MATSTVYRVCGHCCQQLSEKAFKEHKKLYFHDGVWLTESKLERGCFSDADRSSEPMSVSDPPDPTDEVHVDPDGNFALSADDLAFSGSEHYSETASKSGKLLPV